MSILHVAFYPSHWLAGTRGLSAEETGVYITLVARMYEMAGAIERDDKRLARLCGSKSKAAFVKALEYLIEEGKIIERDGQLINERAEKEIKNATEKSAKAAQAAQLRWDRKANKNNGGSDANASPKHMPQRCQTETETDIIEEPKGSLPVSPKPARKRFEYPEDFERFWSAYPTSPNMPKKAAFAQWTKLDEDDRVKALYAVGPFKAWASKQQNYSPVYAERFLSQRRFDGYAEQAKPQLVHSRETTVIGVHDEPELFDEAVRWAEKYLSHAVRHGQEHIKIPAHVAANLRDSLKESA